MVARLFVEAGLMESCWGSILIGVEMNRLKEGIYRVCKLLLVVNIWRGFQELVARFCSACVSTRGSSFGRCASVMTDFVEITFSLASPLNHLSLP